MTTATLLRPQTFQAVIPLFAASLFITLAAQIAIPLPMSPVPLSLQTLAIMCVGATLGSTRGALAVALYLLEIACGMPFAAGGMGGILHLIGPHAGYFAGFVVQAYLTGLLFEKIKLSNRFLAWPLLCGISALQLGIGSLWLSHSVGLANAFAFGFFPFVTGDALKALIFLFGYPALQKKL